MILGDYKEGHDRSIRINDSFGIASVVKIRGVTYTIIEREPHQVLFDRPLEQDIPHRAAVVWIDNVRNIRRYL